MNDTTSVLRRILLESFVMFSVCGVCALIYLHTHPYTYPDLAGIIYQVFLLYVIVLLTAYYPEVATFLLRFVKVGLITITDIFGSSVQNRIAASITLAEEQMRTMHDRYTTAELMIRGVRATFQVLLITFLLTLLIRELYPGVTMWVNINYFLILVLIFGIAAVLTNDEDQHVHEPVTITKRDYIFIGAASIAGTAIVWYKIQDIGKLAYLIAILSGALIFLLSILVLDDDEAEQSDSAAGDISQWGEL
jgi:hypothetical protein